MDLTCALLLGCPKSATPFRLRCFFGRKAAISFTWANFGPEFQGLWLGLNLFGDRALRVYGELSGLAL